MPTTPGYNRYYTLRVKAGKGLWADMSFSPGFSRSLSNDYKHGLKFKIVFSIGIRAGYQVKYFKTD